MIRKLLFIILVQFISISLFARAMDFDYDPNGSHGQSGERMSVPGTDSFKCISEEWADDFIAQINERLEGKQGEFEKYHAEQAMISIRQGMENEPEFCQPPLTTDAGVKMFMLVMAEAFFVKESGCKPQAVNPDAPNGNAIGFGQMGIGDAKNHRCTKPDGSKVSTEDELKDPETNARCVAQIMMNCASGLPNAEGNMQGPGHVGKIASGDKGQLGFAGCFWQPMRKGTGGDGRGGTVDNQTNREAIMEVTAEFCEQAHASRGRNVRDHLIALGFVSEETFCSALSGNRCEEGQRPLFTPFSSTTAI